MKNHSSRENVFEKVSLYVFKCILYYYFIFKNSFTFLYAFFPLEYVTFWKGIFHLLRRYIDDIPLLFTFPYWRCSERKEKNKREVVFVECGVHIISKRREKSKRVIVLMECVVHIISKREEKNVSEKLLKSFIF